MKSYYCEGRGLPCFLEKVSTVKDMLTSYFKYECECRSGRNLQWVPYMRLLGNVCDKSKELFERDPVILFRIELLMPQKQVFIRIKNSKQEIITILTIYFSRSPAEIESHCKESEEWSKDAFSRALRE